jgi:hypothetical protein
MNAINRKLFLSIGAVAALGCGAAWAEPSAAICGSVTSVERRIVEHADQGMGSLRSFVGMTTVVHGIDMWDVKESLDSWRAAVRCQDDVAAAKAAIETAKAEPADKVLTAGR